MGIRWKSYFITFISADIFTYTSIYTTLTSQAQKLEKNREREARHVLDSIFLSTSIRAQEPHGPQYIQLSLPPSLRPFDLRSSSSKNEMKIYIRYN